MSYEPTNWKSGDIVTSQKLNKLENGVAASGLFVIGLTLGTMNDNSALIMDKTLGEIRTAWSVGPVFVIPSTNGTPGCYIAEPWRDGKEIKVKAGEDTIVFATDNDGDDEYPYISVEGK